MEIVDVHLDYLEKQQLRVFSLKKDIKWFDTGDAEEMLEASNYVQRYQKNKKTLVGSIELVALKNGWISKNKFKLMISKYSNSQYKKNLQKFC